MTLRVYISCKEALADAERENAKLRAALEEIAAITILPVKGYQKKAVQIARAALANEQEK